MGIADDIIRQALEGTEKGLRETAHEIARQAERNMPVGDPELDPAQEIALRDSVRVEASIQGGYFIIVDTPYAAKQEFDMRLRHPRGGGSRFLQRALHQAIPSIDKNAARSVSEKMFGFAPDRTHRKRRSRG